MCGDATDRLLNMVRRGGVPYLVGRVRAGEEHLKMERLIALPAYSTACAAAYFGLVAFSDDDDRLDVHVPPKQRRTDRVVEAVAHHVGPVFIGKGQRQLRAVLVLYQSA